MLFVLNGVVGDASSMHNIARGPEVSGLHLHSDWEAIPKCIGTHGIEGDEAGIGFAPPQESFVFSIEHSAST